MADADDNKTVQPMNIYTAMMVLSFLAVSIGCLILAIELYSRSLPLKPGSGGPASSSSAPSAAAASAEPALASEEVE